MGLFLRLSSKSFLLTNFLINAQPFESSGNGHERCFRSYSSGCTCLICMSTRLNFFFTVRTRFFFKYLTYFTYVFFLSSLTRTVGFVAFVFTFMSPLSFHFLIYSIV